MLGSPSPPSWCLLFFSGEGLSGRGQPGKRPQAFSPGKYLCHFSAIMVSTAWPEDAASLGLEPPLQGHGSASGTPAEGATGDAERARVREMYAARGTPSLGWGGTGPGVEVKRGGCWVQKVLRRVRTPFRSLVICCRDSVRYWIWSFWGNGKPDSKSTTVGRGERGGLIHHSLGGLGQLLQCPEEGEWRAPPGSLWQAESDCQPPRPCQERLDSAPCSERMQAPRS